MYTLFNTKSLWPVSAGPANQVFYSAVPGTPIMVNQPITNAVSLGPSPFYYQVQPRWLTSANPAVPSRSRMSSDDVFLPEGAYVYEEPVYVMTGHAPPARQPQKSARPPKHRSRDSSKSRQHDTSSSPDTSKDNGYTTPHKGGYFSENSSNASSHSNDSSPSSEPTDDSFLLTLFPASLAAALNEDPPEPKNRVPPKTSSPIHEETTNNALHIDLGKIRKRRGRFITSSSSEKCKRFSENGVCEELDQCDKILLQSRADTAAEEQAKKREEFLLVLEAERERQKKLVLPRHTPKMMCKFCKNNGESPEVYTKHRLHYNEKTVCPILRHYVCRLCNSTGDFAHTIRHCPFNDRKDKIAWKATFMV